MTRHETNEFFYNEAINLLKEFKAKYRFFEKGDFGALTQIEFDSNVIGGNIDFWEHGWLGIFIWSYKRNEQLLNILLRPDQPEEKKEAFKKIKMLL